MIERLARALRDNEAPNPYANYFEVATPSNGIPPRAGYYVGYRVASLAARKYSLYRLAHLRGRERRLHAGWCHPSVNRRS